MWSFFWHCLFEYYKEVMTFEMFCISESRTLSQTTQEYRHQTAVSCLHSVSQHQLFVMWKGTYFSLPPSTHTFEPPCHAFLPHYRLHRRWKTWQTERRTALASIVWFHTKMATNIQHIIHWEVTPSIIHTFHVSYARASAPSLPERINCVQDAFQLSLNRKLFFNTLH